MFEFLRSEVEAYYVKKEIEFQERLDAMTCKEALESWTMQDLMTPKAFELVSKSDGMIPDLAKSKIKSRFEAQMKRDMAKRYALLDAVAAAPPTMSASVTVEWKRNPCDGMNPHAYLSSDANRTEGKATGGGYDKESAAIASAINRNPDVLRILYEHAEQKKEFPYSVCLYTGLPYFDGGCGVSCFRDVFDACGYEWHDVHHNKMLDCYSLNRKSQ